MGNPITLGTAVAQPGTIQYGQWDGFQHPTGQTEFLPVIIAQGRTEGPCIWLTAGIHGPEHTGPVVLYRLLTPDLVDRLHGTIVVIPALSPVGLRTMSYEPYHAPENPNRMWPDGRPAKAIGPEKRPPHSLERAFARLFDSILETADYLIDYHNAWTGSLTFAFRDRVLYRPGDDPQRSRAEAEKLASVQEEMLTAYGHTVVTDLPAPQYVEEKMHRSTSGAALMVGRIPSITVELGTGEVPDPAIVEAAAAGTRNVLRWAGMLDGPAEPIEGVDILRPGYRVRWTGTVRVEQACVVLHLVQPGDIVHAGDPLCETRDVWGRPVGEGALRAGHDGFVIGHEHGIYHYPGDTVVYVTIPDDAPVVAPYPDGYFEEKPAKAESPLPSG